jgi:hypothetical protein
MNSKHFFLKYILHVIIFVPFFLWLEYVHYGPLVACYEGIACSRAGKRKGHQDLAELMGQCGRFVSTVLRRLHVGVVKLL